MQSNITNNRLQGLSVVRTIGALSVLFGHFYLMGKWGNGVRVWLPEVYLPVTTFFVISGFLITWGLLREYDQTGNVSLRDAYRRRAIRILPLYYMGIGVGLVALWLLGGKIEGNMPLLLCLLPNVAHVLDKGVFPFYHYWTMGTEIMFYLWFPWIIKYGRRHASLWIAVTGGLWLLLKYGTYVVLGTGQVYRFFSATQFDTIMIGAIGAAVY